MYNQTLVEKMNEILERLNAPMALGRVQEVVNNPYRPDEVDHEVTLKVETKEQAVTIMQNFRTVMNTEEKRGVAVYAVNETKHGFQVFMQIHEPVRPGYIMTNSVASE